VASGGDEDGDPLKTGPLFIVPEFMPAPPGPIETDPWMLEFKTVGENFQTRPAKLTHAEITPAAIPIFCQRCSGAAELMRAIVYACVTERFRQVLVLFLAAYALLFDARSEATKQSTLTLLHYGLLRLRSQ